MSIWEAILQGIIQGLTEFLPVSSSGHLSISQHIFGLQLPGIAFDIMLHVGTLLAVIFVYRELIVRLCKELVAVCKDVAHKEFRWSEMSQDRRLLMMLIIGLLPLFLLFLPIPGAGMKVKDLSEQLASDTGMVAEGLALIATGGLLFWGIWANKKLQREKMIVTPEGKKVHTKGRKVVHTIDAVCMGFGQMLAAVFPGLSRSGTTMSVGLLRGISRQTALDYSFVLGIPAIAAAALVSLKDIGEQGAQVGAGAMIVGLLTAMVVGFLAIKLLKWIVNTDKLVWFVYYTVGVGVLVTILGLIEHLLGHNLFTGTPL